MQVGRTEKQAQRVIHNLRYLPGKDALKLRAEVRLQAEVCAMSGTSEPEFIHPSHAMQVAIQLAAAQRQRAKLDKQLWNLTKQGV